MSLSKPTTQNRPRVIAAKKYGVFLVEDHPSTRAALAALINREDDLYICGDADNVHDALVRIAKLEPAIIVSDIALRTSNGIELMKKLVSFCPDVPILAISAHDEKLYAESAIQAGARGFMAKARTAEKLISVVRRMLSGEIYLSER
jgi:DNA-binding NarL/FixJ family response regulator